MNEIKQCQFCGAMRVESRDGGRLKVSNSLDYRHVGCLECVDTREKLEADIAEYKRFHASDKLADLMLVDVVRCWLNRQAAITHELDNVWTKAQQTRIAELTEELKCYEGVDEAKEMWAKACQRERDKNAELTAERDDLAHELRRARKAAKRWHELASGYRDKAAQFVETIETLTATVESKNAHIKRLRKKLKRARNK